MWWLHRVLACTDDKVKTRIYGTLSPDLRQAKFRPLLVHMVSNQIRFVTDGSGKVQPWTQVFTMSSMPKLVLARHLVLNADGRLSARSFKVLNTMENHATHADLHHVGD